MADPTHMIVVMAFNRNPDGTLRKAFEPVMFDNEDQSEAAARELQDNHAGVIAGSRKSELTLGEYGEPVEIYRYGEVPEME